MRWRMSPFNASIEAARAGVHGKGFAVVAEEVGKLASMSGKSANEIRSLLEKSRTKILNILNLTVEKIMDGQTKTKEVSHAFKDIQTGMMEISNRIDSISNGAMEQAKGIKQIDSALHKMEKVAKINTESSNETFSVSKEIEVCSKIIGDIAVKTKSIIFGN